MLAVEGVWSNQLDCGGARRSRRQVATERRSDLGVARSVRRRRRDASRVLVIRAQTQIPGQRVDRGQFDLRSREQRRADVAHALWRRIHGHLGQRRENLAVVGRGSTDARAAGHETIPGQPGVDGEVDGIVNFCLFAEVRRTRDQVVDLSELRRVDGNESADLLSTAVGQPRVRRLGNAELIIVTRRHQLIVGRHEVSVLGAEIGDVDPEPLPDLMLNGCRTLPAVWTDVEAPQHLVGITRRHTQ